jgi:hypothetical protein
MYLYQIWLFELFKSLLILILKYNLSINALNKRVYKLATDGTIDLLILFYYIYIYILPLINLEFFLYVGLHKLAICFQVLTEFYVLEQQAARGPTFLACQLHFLAIY